MSLCLTRIPWTCVLIGFWLPFVAGSYLVAEWKHSVAAGDYEADECPQTLQSLKNDDIPCKKVPVRSVHSFGILVDHFRPFYLNQ